MASPGTDAGKPPVRRAGVANWHLSEQDRHALTRPLLPSLTIGATAGTTGVVVGYFAGLASSETPRLFATAMGLQWLGLSSTFWYIRSVTLLKRSNGAPTPRQELQSSAVGGTVAGGIMGALRSRSNVLPGAVIIGLLGLAGQRGVHVYSKWRQDRKDAPGLWHQVASWKWVPIKALSDDEYEQMLTDRLLRTEAELSLLEEKMTALRHAQAGTDGVGTERRPDQTPGTDSSEH